MKLTIRKNNLLFLLIGMLLIGGTSCSSTVSYAELLTTERESTNAYLANFRVVNHVPADSIFEYGEDAPFYRMDEDGFVYMQVINPGDLEDKAESGELIYFRFMRFSLNDWADGTDYELEGNADDVSYSSTSIRYLDFSLSSTYQYGMGIHTPLGYLGVDCEVNIIIKSQYGIYDEISDGIPYLYNVRYFRSQI
ncbi:MAG: DUF4827 family protein [Bacteroidales bacterium]